MRKTVENSTNNFHSLDFNFGSFYFLWFDLYASIIFSHNHFGDEKQVEKTLILSDFTLINKILKIYQKTLLAWLVGISQNKTQAIVHTNEGEMLIALRSHINRRNVKSFFACVTRISNAYFYTNIMISIYVFTWTKTSLLLSDLFFSLPLSLYLSFLNTKNVTLHM